MRDGFALRDRVHLQSRQGLDPERPKPPVSVRDNPDIIWDAHTMGHQRQKSAMGKVVISKEEYIRQAVMSCPNKQAIHRRKRAAVHSEGIA